jgi:hypothetical protein
VRTRTDSLGSACFIVMGFLVIIEPQLIYDLVSSQVPASWTDLVFRGRNPSTPSLELNWPTRSFATLALFQA